MEIISIGLKTLRRLEEFKTDEDVNSVKFKHKASSYYWDNDVEFKINIDSLVEIHNKVDGEFSPGARAILHAHTQNGTKDVILSRRREDMIGPGKFILTPVK